METIGVGLIGTGYMGKCHALAWNAVRPVFASSFRPRLVHLADADPANAREKAESFGFEKATGDWRDVIADATVDVVSIAAPNALHAEIAVAALEAGKHVWCEKPMATGLEEAERMRATARAAGRIVILGYNYIQNPMIRQINDWIEQGAIGEINHVRLEMDEDFMADSAAAFSLKSAASSGYGALDDFAVHPLSLLVTLLGHPVEVMADMAMPYATRPDGKGGAKAVETHDIANVLFRLENGASGALLANRSAWGRKGRIALQIFGAEGSITYDQERMNEARIYRAGETSADAGYTTVLAGPAHAPYGSFVPAPGHGLGFNDLKVIECHELLQALAGHPARVIDFETGFQIERAVHAMARSHASRQWERL